MVKDLETASLIICDLASVEVEEVYSQSRAWPLPVCRYILWLHLRKQGYSTTKIGKIFNRDHSTISAGLKTIREWTESNNKYVGNLYKLFKERCN